MRPTGRILTGKGALSSETQVYRRLTVTRLMSADFENRLVLRVLLSSTKMRTKTTLMLREKRRKRFIPMELQYATTSNTKRILKARILQILYYFHSKLSTISSQEFVAIWSTKVLTSASIVDGNIKTNPWTPRVLHSFHFKTFFL